MSGSRRGLLRLRRWINGAQVRRHSRLQSRRVVHLFTTFIMASLESAGFGALSSLLSALDIPTNLRESILAAALEQAHEGGNALYNSLLWIINIINADINIRGVWGIDYVQQNDHPVVFISDSDDD